MERSPIAGDETFAEGGTDVELGKREMFDGAIKGKGKAKGSLQFVLNGHCGFGMRWQVKGEVDAEGKLSKVPSGKDLGAGCSKKVKVEAAAWPSNNIVD
jgi:hypothetical protein